MAVYKHTYRGYDGPLTPSWSRFFVPFRFARQALFQSKFHTSFFVLCFFFPLFCLLAIYANAHLDVLSILPGRLGALLEIDGKFFLTFLSVQSSFAFLLTAFIGPGLISPDLANGALTLYLCRPLTRSDYVLGKILVLAIILSFITWVPGLLLFVTQATVAGGHWLRENFWLAAAIVIGSFLWIIVLSLLSLLLSAWFKWRVVAGSLVLAVFFIGASFAQAVNAVLGTRQGYLLDLNSLIATLEHSLFRDGASHPVPVAEAWIAVTVIAGILLFLLMRKIKPNEVVQ